MLLRLDVPMRDRLGECQHSLILSSMNRNRERTMRVPCRSGEKWMSRKNNECEEKWNYGFVLSHWLAAGGEDEVAGEAPRPIDKNPLRQIAQQINGS